MFGEMLSGSEASQHQLTPLQSLYSVGPCIWHPKIQKDQKSVFFSGAKRKA
jgi:hypothetical protein